MLVFVFLKNLNLSFNLAKEVLNDNYEKMKNSVTPKFTENLSNNISKITNEKVNTLIQRRKRAMAKLRFRMGE